MLGSRIEELLESEMEANGGFAVITDEAKQRQLLLDDEEEDFMDEGKIKLAAKTLLLVFCFQNCSDLLWEKIVLVMEKNFWNSRL